MFLIRHTLTDRPVRPLIYTMDLTLRLKVLSAIYIQYFILYISVVAVILVGRQTFTNNLVTSCMGSGLKDYHGCVDMHEAMVSGEKIRPNK